MIEAGDAGLGVADGFGADAGVAAGRAADFGVGRGFFAGAFAGASAGAEPAYAARNFLAAGASMLDEALFTNSPSSRSLATASLLSIPNSFATS